jgi:hypothetical protein
VQFRRVDAAFGRAFAPPQGAGRDGLKFTRYFLPNHFSPPALASSIAIWQEKIMRKAIAALALAGAFALSPLAATAPEIEAPLGVGLSGDDAADVAARQGVVEIDKVEYDRGDHRWTVEGRDYRGNDVEMEIDANTGAILDIDR